MKKMRNDNKGFTLVELIVVLVILAILAAILVPALLGYIDEAKQKQLVLHGKSVYTAAQAVASEYYGKNVEIKNTTTDTTIEKTFATKVATISEISSFGTDAAAWITFGTSTDDTKPSEKHKKWTVKEIIYKEGGQYVKLTTTTDSNNSNNGNWESVTLTSDPTTGIKVPQS